MNTFTRLFGVLLAGCAVTGAAAEMPDAADLKPWMAHGWVGLTTAGNSYGRVEYLYQGVATRSDSVRSIWIAAVRPFSEFPPEHWIARGYKASVSQYWVNCADGSADLRSLTYFSDSSAYNVITNAGFNHATSVPAKFTESRSSELGGAIVQAACK